MYAFDQPPEAAAPILWRTEIVAAATAGQVGTGAAAALIMLVNLSFQGGPAGKVLAGALIAGLGVMVIAIPASLFWGLATGLFGRALYRRGTPVASGTLYGALLSTPAAALALAVFRPFNFDNAHVDLRLVGLLSCLGVGALAGGKLALSLRPIAILKRSPSQNPDVPRP
jgi:hypothetical protein